MKLKFLFLLILFLLPVKLIFSQSKEVKKINFLPMWVPQPQFAGYYMAMEKGIYAKYGLDVTIINGGYDKDVLSYLKDGKADFGIMYLSAALMENAMNSDIVNIGQIFQRSEIMFVAKKKSGINTIKDFEGKKIAVWRTILAELTEAFLKKNTINAEVIRINEGVNIFIKDGVDICAVMHYNEYNNLINMGIDPSELSVFYLRDLGMNFPEDGIYCTETTYNKDPGGCKKFVNASIEGWNYAFSNQEECLAILAKYQKLEKVQNSKTHFQWMLKSMEEILQPPGKNIKTGQLLESDFTNTVQFLLDNKLISNKPDFRQFYRGNQ